MADGFVQVPPDSTGKRIDTAEIQTTSGTVERQRVAVPDAVTVTGDALTQILIEQRIQNLLLAQGLNLNDDVDALRDELLGVVGSPNQVASIQFVMDGGGSLLTTGVKGYLTVPFACTITAAILLADQSGSITVDIWKTSFALFDSGATHPVVGDSITGSTPPVLASATRYQDTALVGWNTAINAGDILAFDVKVAATNITRVTVELTVTKT